MQSLFDQIEVLCGEGPGDDEFAMWRAVLSLVHADDELAALEGYLVQSVMQVFKFSELQVRQIESDIKTAPDSRGLFKAIESSAHRAQFFRLARILIWCDGILHEDELAVVDAIKEELGDDVGQYESDLRWMNRKPDLPIGESAESSEEDIMKQIAYQMISFYERYV